VRTYTEAELRKIIKEHGNWLRDEGGKRADLTGADLSGAYLTGANLTGANLAGAYLAGADLTGADLAGANLTRANLTRADLAGANLTRARGITPERCTPLLMLLDQPGPIRAYKIVGDNNEGIYNGGLRYEVGTTLEVKNANTDPNKQCAEGINLATLDWCLRVYQPGHKVLICEFTAGDIACIPIATDGKFRVRKCKVIGEKDISELV